MDETLLETVLNFIGPILDPEGSYNNKLLLLIESTLLDLHQVGAIKEIDSLDEDTTWGDIINVPSFSSESNPIVLTAIKQYVCIGVQLAFDPPSNGNVLNVLKENMDKHIYRIKDAYEYF